MSVNSCYYIISEGGCNKNILGASSKKKKMLVGDVYSVFESAWVKYCDKSQVKKSFGQNCQISWFMTWLLKSGLVQI